VRRWQILGFLNKDEDYTFPLAILLAFGLCMTVLVIVTIAGAVWG